MPSRRVDVAPPERASKRADERRAAALEGPQTLALAQRQAALDGAPRVQANVERAAVLQRVSRKKKFPKQSRTYYEFVRKGKLGKSFKKRSSKKKHRVLDKSSSDFLGVLLEGVTKKNPVSDLILSDDVTTEEPTTPDYQTTEEGYEGFNVTDASDWDVLDSVVEKQGKTIVKKGGFKLPVICSTASEHIIRHRGKSTIPDWDPTEGCVSTGVTVHDDTDTDIAKDFDLGTDEIPTSILTKTPVWTNPGRKKFTPSSLGLGEGILAYGSKPIGVGDHHAVVVVARNNKTNEIIVVERNAGETTGSTSYSDDRWLLNSYLGPEGFLKQTGLKKGFKLVGR